MQLQITGLHKDGEIAAIHHLHTRGPCGFHQVTKTGIHFRRATGDIEQRKRPFLQHLQHQIDGCPIHQLSALGAGIHMTVGAGLMAKVTQIYLQGTQVIELKGWKVGFK